MLITPSHNFSLASLAWVNANIFRRLVDLICVSSMGKGRGLAHHIILGMFLSLSQLEEQEI